jgi:midasin (ATPase involved in ribosome maturation)
VIFAQTINKRVMEPLCPQIIDNADKLFKLKDVTSTDYDMQSILKAQEVLTKLMSFMMFIIDSQLAVMHSLSKFSYCTQRVFLYLIY